MKTFLVKFVDSITGRTAEKQVKAKDETAVRKAQAGIARQLVSIVML